MGYRVSPMVRATLQAALLSGISNVLAQLFQSHRNHTPMKFDHIEFLRFVIVTLITAPPNYRWQEYLERKLPAYNTPIVNSIPLNRHDLLDEKKRRDSNDASPADAALAAAGAAAAAARSSDWKPSASSKNSQKSRNWRNTFLKMFIDSITVGALVNTVLFLALMGVLKGLSRQKIVQAVRQETIPVMVAGYKIWPAISFLGFTFVPVEKRIVFFSVFGLFWNIYMSIVAAKV